MTASQASAHSEPGNRSSVLALLRPTELSRLDRHDEVYLDYTGSALYAESHVDRHAKLLCDSVLGNPHSDSPASCVVRRGVAVIARWRDQNFTAKAR